MRADVLRVYPFVDPDRVRVVHNGIDVDGWAPPSAKRAPRPRSSRGDGYGIDPDRPAVVFVGRITRQKGLPVLPARRRAPLARDPGRPVRGRSGHPGDRRRGLRGRRDAPGDARRRDLDREDASARRSSSRSSTRAPSSCARPSTSPSASSTSRRWPSACPWSGPRRAASPRWSSTARHGILVPIEQATDGTGTPLDPERFVADLAVRARGGRGRSRAGRGDGRRGQGAGGGALLVGVDRRADHRRLRGPPGVSRRGVSERAERLGSKP